MRLSTGVRWVWLSGALACFVFGDPSVRAQSVQCRGVTEPLAAHPASAAKSASAAPVSVPPQDITVSCGTSSNSLAVNSDSGALRAPTDRPPLLLQVLDALTRFLGVVIWPLLLFTFLLVFRKPVSRLIDRIKSLSWGDKGAEFAEGVIEAEDRAGIEPAPETVGDVERQARLEAHQNPRGAILSAWLEVEQAVGQLVKSLNLAPGNMRIQARPFTAMRLLRDSNAVDPQYASLFEDLRVLRNQAAHAQEFDPPPEAVIRYVELAKQLAEELRRKSAEPTTPGSAGGPGAQPPA